ncbi:hypothetical protein Kazakh3173_10330 [Helicobacter pylori]
MHGLWIYPEDTEVLGVACKSLLKALTPRYQKIALFSPIDGGREGFWERYGLNLLEFHNAIDKQKALELSILAPLHNPANLAGIEFVQKAHPHIPQIAVFDTAFHATMPSYAYMYALPYELYEKYQIRRYGFHGTSHHYVAKEAAKFLNIPYEEFNAISLHLGNGSSAAAIQKGKSVDTSMGLTPLEGLIMGTRCGDIDPTVVEYTVQCANKSLEEVMKILNYESGLKGICGDNEKHRSQKGKRR